MIQNIASKLVKLTAICLIALACVSCQPSTRDPGITYITLWHGINPPYNREVFQQLVDRFNQKQTDIYVDPIYVGQPDQQLPKILTAVVGNTAPDLLFYNPTLTSQLVELDAIEPLETWLNSLPLKSEIDPALFESMQFEEHWWSVPMTTNNVAVFYRPSLFQAAGIKTLPQTWEEFRAAAQRLTQDTTGNGVIDQHAIVLPLGKGEWTVFTWLPFFFSAEGELVQDDQVQLFSSEAVAALQFWVDLLQDGSAILSEPERGYEQQDFIAGKVAMQITGPWTLEYLDNTGIDYGVMPIPAQAQSATVVGGENLFLMKTSEDRQQAAQQFLRYVLSPEFQTEWSLGTGYLPVNLKTRQSPDYQTFVAQKPALKVFLEQVSGARSRPIIPHYSRVSDSLGRSIEATLLGEAPEVALKQGQRRINLIFD